MSMSTVFVDASEPRRRRELARDARDPFDQQKAIEQAADAYSRGGKVVQVYPSGRYVKPWRESREPLYESAHGRATPGYRPPAAEGGEQP